MPGRARDRVRVCVRVRVPYPAWFFLNQVSRVWVERSIAAPLSGSEPPRQQLSVNRRDGWAVGRLRRLNRTVAMVQTEPLQLFVGFGPDCPSRSAINSAPYSQLKTHQQQERNLTSEGDPLSLSLSLEVTSKQEVGNQ